MKEEVKASELMGKEVRTTEGRRIGAFSDLVFFPETRDIPLAVVSYGGIAGFRRKRRAIRFRWVTFRRGVPFLRLRIDWAQWKQAPELDWVVPSAQNVKEALAGMPEGFSEEGRESELSGAGDVADGGAGDGRERRGDVVWGQGAGIESVPFGACVALGMVAVGIDDREIGVVRDFLIDLELGRIRRLVLAFGGVLGFGGDTRSVGASGLEIDVEFDQVRVPLAGRELLDGKWRRT